MLLTCVLVFQNQLSGNLLRKFKNSNGWQKLWVVFTNFCLFFYKSHQVSTTWDSGDSTPAGGRPSSGRANNGAFEPPTRAWREGRGV